MMETTNAVTAETASGLSELGMATEAGPASWTLDTLRDERVRNCFLGIFRSDLSSEEKGIFRYAPEPLLPQNTCLFVHRTGSLLLRP
jgi:hypothetical protein